MANQQAMGRQRVQARLQKRLVELEQRGIQIPRSLWGTTGTLRTVHRARNIFKKNVESSKRPWTPDEEKRFLQILEKYPKSESNVKTRWELVSGDMPGRSRRACLLKFKELKGKEREAVTTTAKVQPSGVSGAKDGEMKKKKKETAKNENKTNKE